MYIYTYIYTHIYINIYIYIYIFFIYIYLFFYVSIIRSDELKTSRNIDIKHLIRYEANMYVLDKFHTSCLIMAKSYPKLLHINQ